MKKIKLLILLMGTCFAASSQIEVMHLLCNKAKNPLAVATKQPLLSWQMETDKLKNVMQTAYQIIVADDENNLVKGQGNMWDSKKVFSSQSLHVAYKGKTLLSTKKYYWSVRVWDNKNHFSKWSKPAVWQMGLLEEKEWNKAKWIAYENLPDTSIIIPHVHLSGKKAWGKRPNILPLFRKDFETKNKIKSATIFISGLGHFELSLNGEKVGTNFLDPGWTHYSKEALYVGFNVTNQLQFGKNTIGVMLGNGFYYIPSERYRKMTGAYGYPKMICNLVIEYADGKKESIVSDASWKTSPSPIIFTSIFGGEDYDATKEQQGWNTTNFSDGAWKNAVITTGHPLNAQITEPVKIMQQFNPIATTKITDSIWVFDCSQNMSGIPQITVKGKRGDTIKILLGELIHDNGTVNQKATGSPHFYQYILKGNSEEETWHPQFTYYGFRYIQVERAIPSGNSNPTQLPTLMDVKALHIRNSTASVGAFSSSNDLFNKTNTLIDWSIKNNMVSLFTDCPTREKLGWLEQTYLMGSSAMYQYDIYSLSKKMLGDMRSAQTNNGLIPEIAPEFTLFAEPFRDSPEWGSASIILPWYMYQWYGDKTLLNENYSMMKKYMQYLQSKDSSRILSQGLGDWFDLGPNRPGFSQLTTKGLTATATYYYNACILQKIATLLKVEDDAKLFSQLANEIKIAFNKAFFNYTTKQYATGSQTSNAMALYVGLVDKENEAAVLNNLIADIKNRNYALTAGDIGYRYLLKVLAQYNKSDIIFLMNNRSDVPGYGYQIAKGATALTESWQALPNVSNNHFMLGHIMEWFYAGLAGINQTEKSIAFKNIVIKPQVVANITHAKASYQSAYGIIASEWTKNENEFKLSVTIPANTNAIVYLPATIKSKIMLDGKTIKINQFKESKAVVNIGSGSYEFQVVN